MRKALWILSALPIIITAFALQFMPDKVPLHYNISGEIDRWGSKYEQIIFPLIIIGASILWEVIICFFNKKAQNASEDKQRAEAVNNIKVIKTAAVATTAVLFIMQCVFLYNAYTSAGSDIAYLEIDSMKITCLLLGIMFIVLGNILPKTKLNGAIGLRISYSMYNDVTWSKSNRFGGLVLIVAGVLTMICSVIFDAAVVIILMLVFIIAATIVMVMYAKKVYDIEKKREE
ncbi:MAG: DUF1648 domain-containing protein [Oscillospiraceae bacterium]